VTAPTIQPSRKRLFEIASIQKKPSSSAGTAMTLQIDHRESRDVDIADLRERID
jgi:hypothetical protein